MAAAARRGCSSVVQPPHRAGDGAFELLNQRFAISFGAELAPDSKAGKGLHLCDRLGAVSKALHQLEIVCPLPVRHPGFRKAAALAQLEVKHMRSPWLVALSRWLK